LPALLSLGVATPGGALLPGRLDTVLDTSNGLAQNGRDYCTPLTEPVKTPPLLNGGKCTVIVAMYGQSTSELELMRMLFPFECDIVIFDKDTKPCSFMPLSGIKQCVGLPNVGREQHTWSYYVSQNYDKLPDYLFMVPADLPAHDRAHSVQVMLNSTIFNTTRPGGLAGEGFWCIDKSAGKLCDGFATQPPMGLDVCQGCAMTQYCRGGNASSCVEPTPASPSPLGSWLQGHIGQYSPNTMNRMCHLPLCHYGVAGTTKENLLAHPKEVYESIVATLNTTVMPESIWMMEWAMSAAYGILSARKQPPCKDGPPYKDECAFAKHQPEPSPLPGPQP